MTSSEFKSQRSKLELTQEQLANLLGVARNTVARWEMGMHPVSTPVELLLKMLTEAKPQRERKPR